MKLKQKVELKTEIHNWHVTHINLVFLRPGSKEFEKQNYEEIALLLGSKAKKTKLKGTVVGFGADDDSFKDNRPFVLVEFKWKELKCSFYCSEKDLDKVK